MFLNFKNIQINKQTIGYKKMLTKNTIRQSANAGGYKIKGTSFSTLTDTANQIKVWYSYATPVAITDIMHNTTYVSVNNWSVTTAKHLNEIDGGSITAKRLRLAPQDWLAVKILFGVEDRNTLQGESFKSPSIAEVAALTEARV
jgi:hypothetical protein